MKETVYQRNKECVKNYLEIVKIIISKACNQTNYQGYQDEFVDIKDKIFSCVCEDMYRDIILLHRFISDYFELLKHKSSYDTRGKDDVVKHFSKIDKIIFENIKTEIYLSSAPSDAVRHGKIIEKSNMTYEQMEKYLRDIKEF